MPIPPKPHVEPSYYFHLVPSQHHRLQNMAVHPQPIPFKLLTWWLLKSNGLSTALFLGEPKLPLHAQTLFHSLTRTLLFTAFHPSSQFSARAFTRGVCKWKDSCNLPGLSPSHLWSSPQLRSKREFLRARVYLWAWEKKKPAKWLFRIHTAFLA